MDAREVLSLTLAQYSNARTYSDTGTESTHLVCGARRYEYEVGGFKTYFECPVRLRFEYDSTKRSMDVLKLEKETQVLKHGLAADALTLEQALEPLCKFMSHVPRLILPLLLREEFRRPSELLEIWNPRYDGQDVFAKTKRHRISGTIGRLEAVVWIDSARMLITKFLVRMELKGGPQAPSTGFPLPRVPDVSRKEEPASAIETEILVRPRLNEAIPVGAFEFRG